MTDPMMVLDSYHRGPEVVMNTFGALCQQEFGHRLMTIFAWDRGSNMCARIWSSQPDTYPVPAEKEMGPTEWGMHVLHRGLPWFGADDAAVRAAFFDHEKIRAQGCGACIAAPVIWDGETIGAVSVLDAEGAYSSTDANTLAKVTPLLAGVLLARLLTKSGVENSQP